jgi:hypothetical protein
VYSLFMFPLGYIPKLSVSRLYGTGWLDDGKFMMNWKGRGPGPIEVHSRHLTGGAEENDENPQSV